MQTLQSQPINVLDESVKFERAVRTAQKEQTLQEIEKKYLQGLESGFGEPVTSKYWENLWKRVLDRVNQRKGKNSLSLITSHLSPVIDRA